MSEAGEGPPVKQSALSKLVNRIRGRPAPEPHAGEGLAGTRTAEQINEAAQQYPKPQQEVTTAIDRPSTQRVSSPEDQEVSRPLSEEIVTIPSQEPLPENAADWRQKHYEVVEQARGVNPPEQVAEEARIDAENLAKFEDSPSVQPKTTLPEKVFGPQPEVPDEHKEVEEFLKTQPKPTSETTPPVQPEAVAPPVSPTAAETSVQIPVETTQPQTEIPVPVEATAPEEKPIPVSIQAKTPVSVGVAEPVGKQSI